MLKIGCLVKLQYVSQVCLKVFLSNFLHNSGERHVGELGGKGWFIVRSRRTGAIKLAMAGT